MQIFIDESGNFIKKENFSTICALALPNDKVENTRKQIYSLLRNWGKKNKELKGSWLKGNHVIELVEILFENETTLFTLAIDVSKENSEDIDRHQREQMEYLKKVHNQENQPDADLIKNALETLKEKKIPDQLYIQYVNLTELIWCVFQTSLIYYRKYKPDPLGAFKWKIDQKASNITSAENYWCNLVNRFIAIKSRTTPLVLLRDSDLEGYKKLNPTIKDYDNDRELVANNALRDITFIDSKDDILIQAADVMANYMRRMLNEKINDKKVIEGLGKLHMKEQVIVEGVLKFLPIEWSTFNSDWENKDFEEHAKAFSRQQQENIILLNSTARKCTI